MALIAQSVLDLYIPAGEIIAAGISEDEYMERFAADHCEWVRGFVIKMSPTQLKHLFLVRYLSTLIETYFAFRPIGMIIGEPIVMRLSQDSNREPDLMVIFEASYGNLKPTYYKGAADICIEVISPESQTRDRVDKLYEYQKGGVREYWLFDPTAEESLFYSLNDQRLYMLQHLDEDQRYRPSSLPGFVLHVPTLWQDPLPNPVAIVESVKAMLDAEQKP